MSRYYILDGRKVVPTDDTSTWAAMFEDKSRIVAQDNLENARISTVFLGLNHRYGDGPPLIFETMIFGGEHDQYQERYSTWDEAEAGHRTAIELVKSGEPPVADPTP